MTETYLKKLPKKRSKKRRRRPPEGKGPTSTVGIDGSRDSFKILDPGDDSDVKVTEK